MKAETWAEMKARHRREAVAHVKAAVARNGHSQAAAAKEMGVGRAAVCMFLSRNNVSTRKQAYAGGR